MELSFTKMQGCANDYIYLDCRTAGVPENIAALSEKLSRRHFSIGADGIICICAPRTAGADDMMRIFNADGSEGRMCGNGIRCVAEWLYTHGVHTVPFQVPLMIRVSESRLPHPAGDNMDRIYDDSYLSDIFSDTSMLALLEWTL